MKRRHALAMAWVSRAMRFSDVVIEQHFDGIYNQMTVTR